MNLFRMFVATMLAIYGFAAHAQTLPKPKEFYFDQDAGVARRIVIVEGAGEAPTEQLLKIRERGRKQVEANAQLAHIAMAGARTDLGKTLYQQAMGAAPPSSSLGRSVRWNYAWDLYAQGDHQAALNLWAELASGYSDPAWLPPTLALALWSADRKTEALKWYAAAVRTEPNLWADPANFPSLLPDWREQDRARLAEVQAAWAANPPAWP